MHVDGDKMQNLTILRPSYSSLLCPCPLEVGHFKPTWGSWERRKHHVCTDPGRKRIWYCLKLWENQLKPARGSGLGKRCKFPSGIRGSFIKLRESQWWQSFWIFWTACRHNTVPLSLIRSTVMASVRRQKGGGAEPAGPPSKSATDWCCWRQTTSATSRKHH